MKRSLYLILVAVFLASGCTSMTPGDLNKVQPVSKGPRAGNAYLLRGWIGIFSSGMNSLCDKLNQNGVHTEVFQDDQWSNVARMIGSTYRSARVREPLVLIGHSYGADDVVRIARYLDSEGVNVDLLITLDPVTPPAVPRNVRFTYNLYRSNGVMDTMPWLRGVPLEQVEGKGGMLLNVDIREREDLFEPGTDHFNIEKREAIHAEVIKSVLRCCPSRSLWLVQRSTSSSVLMPTGRDVPKASANR